MNHVGCRRTWFARSDVESLVLSENLVQVSEFPRTRELGVVKVKKKQFLGRHGRVVSAGNLKIYVKSRRDGAQVVLKFDSDKLINVESIRDKPSLISK